MHNVPCALQVVQRSDDAVSDPAEYIFGYAFQMCERCLVELLQRGVHHLCVV